MPGPWLSFLYRSGPVLDDTHSNKRDSSTDIFPVPINSRNPKALLVQDEKHVGLPHQGRTTRAQSSISTPSPGASTTAAVPRKPKNRPRCSITNKCLRFRILFLPIICIIVPILGVASGLIFITLTYSLPFQTDILTNSNPNMGLHKNGYALVDYSTAKFLFASSIASTLSPYLASCIMGFWLFRVGRACRLLGTGNCSSELPDSSQFSHLLNLMTASIDKLALYFNFARRSKSKLPSMLRQTACILSVPLLLSGIIIVCDTSMHYTTNTVSFERLEISPKASTMSRRLSTPCVEFDRSQNNGVPCSMNYLQASNDPTAFVQSQNEIKSLHLNSSSKSIIRLVPSPPNTGSGSQLAILVPAIGLVPSELDYRARSIGASTSCKLVTRDCNFRNAGPHQEYSAFNCSSNFWGMVGKPSPTITYSTDNLDPDLPPLAFKPTPVMQFAFFEDEDLSIPYNSLGLNASIGFETNSNNLMSDTQLKTSVFVGFAAGFSPLQNTHLNYGIDANFYSGSSGYIAFAMSCKYEVFDVDYTWSNGTILNVEASRSQNGTLAELFHGYHVPHQNGFLDYDLPNALGQALLYPDIGSILLTWSNLYSAQIMSVIGAFLVPDTSLVTQIRDNVLATQVPLAPLIILIVSCIGISIFGIVLCLLAWQAGTPESIQIISQLDVEGLSKLALDKSVTFDQLAMADTLLPALKKKRCAVYAQKNGESSRSRLICFARVSNQYEYMVLQNSEKN